MATTPGGEGCSEWRKGDEKEELSIKSASLELNYSILSMLRINSGKYQK